MNIVPQSATLKFITPSAVELIAECARLCYKSEKKGNEAAFLQMLLRKQHFTPFEMADAIFHVTCDRGVSHEAVRHRIASYLQESTRFCNYSSERFGSSINFVEPSGLDVDEHNAWERAMLEAEDAYIKLSETQKPQIARSVLGQGLKTEFYWKMNFHGWLHMLELRYFGLTGPPHPQMVEVATFIHDILVAEVPEVFGPAAFAAKWNGAISAYRKALEKLDG
jgi:thymidylate synthase (FAD)